MVFNYSKLRGRIREMCSTQEQFARAMGRSPASISAKLNNRSEWTQPEINRAMRILKINDAELTAYFFAPTVQVSKHEGVPT